MSNVTITSDGTADNTIILVDDKPMIGVVKIELAPVVVSGTVIATITVDMVHLRMQFKDVNVECVDSRAAELISNAIVGNKKEN